MFLATHSFVDSEVGVVSHVPWWVSQMSKQTNSSKVKHSGYLGCHWDTKFMKWGIWASDPAYKELPRTYNLLKKKSVWIHLRNKLSILFENCVQLAWVWTPQEKRCRNRKKTKNLPKNLARLRVTNEGKYLIFTYFWLQSLFLLMHSPISWLPWYRAVERRCRVRRWIELRALQGNVSFSWFFNIWPPEVSLFVLPLMDGREAPCRREM